MQALAFVDLETTGATAAVDRITEIGIVEVDEDGVREWSQLVNPEMSIPAFIQRMTGITDAMVCNAPTFEQVAHDVLARLKGRLFLAHNARFDYGFLKNEFQRVGLDFRATVLCTVKLSRRLFPQHPRHSLDALIERHGLRAQGRHRALADAQLIHQFWEFVHASRPEEALAVVKELTAPPNLPTGIDPGIVDDLPENPGVYLFYGDDDLPLYVGRARDIKKRMLSHFASDRSSEKEKTLVPQLRRIDWIVTGGDIGAQLREAALIRQLQPPHNRQLPRNAELCAIALVDQGGGLVTPEIAYARDPDFGRRRDLYGLFKNAKEASRVLAEVSTAHAFRLVQALASRHLKAWPFAGPAGIKEGDELHVVDAWCYLGSVKSDEALWTLLDQGQPQFDRDIYRILAKAADRLVPVGASLATRGR